MVEHGRLSARKMEKTLRGDEERARAQAMVELERTTSPGQLFAASVVGVGGGNLKLPSGLSYERWRFWFNMFRGIEARMRRVPGSAGLVAVALHAVEVMQAIMDGDGSGSGSVLSVRVTAGKVSDALRPAARCCTATRR